MLNLKVLMTLLSFHDFEVFQTCMLKDKDMTEDKNVSNKRFYITDEANVNIGYKKLQL